MTLKSVALQWPVDDPLIAVDANEIENIRWSDSHQSASFNLILKLSDIHHVHYDKHVPNTLEIRIYKFLCSDRPLLSRRSAMHASPGQAYC